MPSRRDVLGTLAGAATLSATAGCLGSGGRPILNCVSLTNYDADVHTVHVTVSYGGERVVWQSYELAGYDGGDSDHVDQVWVRRTWPAEPGDFTVRARLDDRTRWETFDGDERAAGNSLHADFEIEEGGTTTFWVNSVPEPEGQCESAPVATGTATGPE